MRHEFPNSPFTAFQSRIDTESLGGDMPPRPDLTRFYRALDAGWVDIVSLDHRHALTGKKCLCPLLMPQPIEAALELMGKRRLPGRIQNPNGVSKGNCENTGFAARAGRHVDSHRVELHCADRPISGVERADSAG